MEATFIAGWENCPRGGSRDFDNAAVALTIVDLLDLKMEHIDGGP